jgi:DUF4097 and DUF4098 domain-containing protein YvlB
MTIATALITLATAAARTDTTIQVKPGARLSVNNFGGAIQVTAWEKNEVHASSYRGHPVRVNYSIVVPGWMPLILQGIYADIMVKGSKSEVTAETVRGEVNVEGGAGFVRASSVEGPVIVAGAQGRVELNSVNDEVTVTGTKGEIVANAVNGDIHLSDVESSLVEASTVNGDVFYLGDLRDKGRYNFSTHNGDLVLGVPDRTNATMSVSTFNGEFDSDIPVSIDETRKGKRFNFTVGSGSAIVNLESFEGTIQLRKPEVLKELVKVRDVRNKQLEKLREVARNKQKEHDKDVDVDTEPERR